MEDEKTIYEKNNGMAEDEKTVLDAAQTQQEEAQSSESVAPAEEPASKKHRPMIASVAGGAGIGLLVGAGSAVLFHGISTATAAENAENPEAETQPENDVPGLVNEEVPVATGVNDSMSFSEAFAAARAEVGAGGVFEWHGGVYGTYYADEWNAMTPEQQDAWSDNFSWDGGSSSTYTAQTSHQSSGHSGEVAESVTPEPVTPEPEPEPDASVISGEEDGPTVEVLGVVHDEETGADMAGYLVDDNLAIFVDVDNNNTVDFIAYDANGDQQFSEDEVQIVTDENIAMSDLPGVEPEPMPEEDYIANNDLPDYVNDADANGYYDA